MLPPSLKQVPRFRAAPGPSTTGWLPMRRYPGLDGTSSRGKRPTMNRTLPSIGFAHLTV